MVKINKYDFIAIASIIIAVTGQLCMKWGLAGFADASLTNIGTIVAILFNLYVLIGFSCYILAGLLWLFALKGLPLSYAFPLQSIGLILIFLFSWVLLKEDISLSRWIGFAIMVSGIALLTSKK